MRWGEVTIVMMVLMIAGCAGTGGTTLQTPAVEAKSDAVASETQSAAAAPLAPVTSSAPKPVAPPLQSAVESGTPIAPTAPVPYKKNRTASAIVVAAGGGLSNGAVGPYMESYKQDLQKSLLEEIRTGIARVEKLPHNVVRIQVSSRLAFDADSPSIKSGFCATMDKLADALNR